MNDFKVLCRCLAAAGFGRVTSRFEIRSWNPFLTNLGQSNPPPIFQLLASICGPCFEMGISHRHARHSLPSLAHERGHNQVQKVVNDMTHILNQLLVPFLPVKKRDREHGASLALANPDPEAACCGHEGTEPHVLSRESSTESCQDVFACKRVRRACTALKPAHGDAPDEVGKGPCQANVTLGCLFGGDGTLGRR